jgi:hypothetical protein
MFVSPEKQCLGLKLTSDFHIHSKGKAIPSQAWTDPEGNRRLTLPAFRQWAHEGGKVASPIHGRLYPQEIFLILVSVRS